MMTFAFDLHALASFAANFEGSIHRAPSMADCIAMGVMCPRDLVEHDALSYCYFDLHKEAYGRKARHVNFKAITIAELELMLDILDDVCVENDRIEKEAENRAIIAFEVRIDETIAMGANDRETALRWILDASDLSWQFGINDIISEQLFFGHEYNLLIDELTSVANKYNLWPMEVAA